MVQRTMSCGNGIPNDFRCLTVKANASRAVHGLGTTCRSLLSRLPANQLLGKQLTLGITCVTTCTQLKTFGHESWHERITGQTSISSHSVKPMCMQADLNKACCMLILISCTAAVMHSHTHAQGPSLTNSNKIQQMKQMMMLMPHRSHALPLG